MYALPPSTQDKPKGSSKSLSLSTPSSGGGRGILYGERKVGEMGFQVKTLAEIRAERKRRFEQRDTVESLRKCPLNTCEIQHNFIPNYQVFSCYRS